jgi:protein involved in polysaccharide export with SLBB domain
MIARTAAIALLTGVVGACASAPTVPPLTVQDVKQLKPAKTEEYRIEFGDTLAVQFPYHPEMKQDALVRPDGKIVVPMVGDVFVAGMTTWEVEKRLVEATSEYLRNPEVRVQVIRLQERHVYVGGEVVKPGLVPYNAALTPLQAVVAAGGFKETGRLDSVILVRTDASGHVVLSRKLDLKAAALHGAAELLGLMPRDVLFVPRTPVADANLWVKQYLTDMIPFLRVNAVPFP